MAEMLASFSFRYSLNLGAARFDGKLQAHLTVIPL
jgi:hypothetical protein